VAVELSGGVAAKGLLGIVIYSFYPAWVIIASSFAILTSHLPFLLGCESKCGLFVRTFPENKIPV